MGTCASQEENENLSVVPREHTSLMNFSNMPTPLQVAHFTPSSFPMIPIVTSKNTKLCEISWTSIVTGDVTDENGSTVSGMTVFYNEFYTRLDQVDTNGRFQAILSRHSSGVNKIAARGAILVRIIKLVLKIETDTKQTRNMLVLLGKSHARKHIRPWQYSVFVQTLLLTLSSRLGVAATNNVMEAWVNLFAYVMQWMLPDAIRGHINVTEMNINTSTDEFKANAPSDMTELEELGENESRRKGGGIISSFKSSLKFSSKSRNL